MVYLVAIVLKVSKQPHAKIFVYRILNRFEECVYEMLFGIGIMNDNLSKCYNLIAKIKSSIDI